MRHRAARIREREPRLRTSSRPRLVLRQSVRLAAVLAHQPRRRPPARDPSLTRRRDVAIHALVRHSRDG